MLPTLTPCNGRSSPPPTRRNARRGPPRAQPPQAAAPGPADAVAAQPPARRGPPPNASSSTRPRKRAAQAAAESDIPLAKRRKSRKCRTRVVENDEAASSSASRGRPVVKIDSLPDEVLEKIFTGLARGDLAAVASLGHRFHGVSNPLLYRNLTGTFEPNDALLLLLTLIKRPNFAMHARVFDGYNIGMSISKAELNLIAGALFNMTNLRALSLPPYIEERHLIQTYNNLRTLHISGPVIPMKFLSRHTRIRHLEVVVQDLGYITDMQYIGPGTPLRFVRCCLDTAVGLLPSPERIRPTARRVLASNAVLQVFPSHGAEPLALQDARAFINGLRSTRTPPGTLVLDRQVLKHVAHEIVACKMTRIRHVHYIRVCIHTAKKEVVKRNQDMESIKALLVAFADLATLELHDDSTPNPPPENEWFNEILCTQWRRTRPSLRLVVSPKKMALEHQASGWVTVHPPVFPVNPFAVAGLRA